MEPVSVILTALVAGAAKPAGQVAQDAYNGLKTLIKKRFEEKGKPLGSSLVDEHEKNEEATKPLLQSKLTEAEIDKDEEILAKAQELLKEVKPEEFEKGTYTLNLAGDFEGVAAQTITGGTYNFNKKQ